MGVCVSPSVASLGMNEVFELGKDKVQLQSLNKIVCRGHIAISF